MRQGVLISTTEHLLSVFYSMGIDNAYIEIDNLEVPILDGSGAAVRRTIGRPGIRHLPPQAALSADPPAGFGGRRRQAHHDPARRSLPADLRHRTSTIRWSGGQSLEMEVTPERYATEIAPARTFGFEYELDQMRNMGLIRGASLENAVCFTRDRRDESRTACASPTNAAATRRST